METKKNPKLSIDRRRNSFYAVGFILATASTLVAFEWTTYDQKHVIAAVPDEVVDFTELPPITVQKPKTIKRPKVKVDFSKAPTLVDNDVEIDTTIDIDEPIDTSSLAITTIYPPDDGDDGDGDDEVEIFVVVENMPTWIGCTGKTAEKRKDYTDENIFRYLSKNVRYPRACVDAGIEGVVYVEYIVDATGKVANVNLMRGTSPLLDKEAMRVVNSFPDFSPGKQRGIPVNVKFTIPIRFTLN